MIPGPAGLGSAEITRTKRASYGSVKVLDTLNAMVAPGATEYRSA